MIKQRTISKKISLTGIGLHTGNRTTITFKPADADTHYVFVRTDIKGKPQIPALVDYVIDISRGTTLGNNGVEVRTVEHVLSALVGLGIDNCIIELSNNEPPVFDGSAMEYVKVLQQANIVELDAYRNYFEISEQVSYKDNDRSVDMVALPLNDYRLTVMIDYFNPSLGSQHTGLFDMEKEFVEHFAPARTFCFYSEVEQLWSAGLIKGGSLDSAVVIVDKNITDENLTWLQQQFNMQKKPIVDESGILNGKKLIYKNEPARHKLLDLIGDLALVGVPIKAQILAARPGHRSNVEFAKLLRKQYLAQKIKDRINPKTNKQIVIDINQILEIMPHRFPFLLVDKITHIDNDEKVIVGIKNVTINEPFFQGHFPNKPIMPGVLIMEAMGQVGGLLIWNSVDTSSKLMFFSGFKNAKFKKPVIPGDQLVYEVKLLSQKFGILMFRGTAFVDGEVVAEAEYNVALVNRE
jgi:UDP-3-O-[3-hydroxymyristoyl] N-acetylglucosamine deacetylase/3-hydroxyacyl-[acyl-carrier-protein] dehydratase